MLGPYVHNIDPVIFSVGGVYLWWYGLSYALGFFNARLFLRRRRNALGLSLQEVDDLSLFLAAGALAGGRSLVVFNNEWSFYRSHLHLIPAIWLGGLATHGLIAGGAAGVLLYCAMHRKAVVPVLDALAIPTALILGCGRIGNFIDGQIVGSVTQVPWAVMFPEVHGFRHPVVLYDGLKNFMLIPLLMWIRSRGVPPGRLAATFIFLYASLRIPIDLLREYPITLWGLPTGQTFNIVMSLIGVALLVRSHLRTSAIPSPLQVQVPVPVQVPEPAPLKSTQTGPVLARRLAFAAILGCALLIPSDATRDIPERYGRRHLGLSYSAMYPPISATITPPRSQRD